MPFTKGHAPFKRAAVLGSRDPWEAMSSLADGIRHAVDVREVENGSYIKLPYDEDARTEKCGMEAVDKYFELLVHTMTKLPGPAPPPKVLREAWKEVAPAYVTAKLINFFVTEEAGKHGAHYELS